MGIFWFSLICMTMVALGFLVVPYWLSCKRQAMVMRSNQVIGIVLFATVFVVGAGALYWHLGASQPLAEMRQAAAQKVEVDAEIARLGSLEQIIATLKQRVMESPDSRGWFLLGRLYLKNQQLQLAVESFKQADRLAPNQPAILVSYAEALYLAQHQSLSAEAKSLLIHALKLQPNQVDALALLAADAYAHKNYREAIAYWEQLLPLFPADSEAGKRILKMIATAQKQAPR